LVFDLEKKRGAQFIGVRDKLVVNGDLFANLIEIGDSLGPQHFLNLKCHRVAVLKYHGNTVAQRDAPLFLFVDDVVTKFLAHLLIGGKTENVVENNLFHIYYCSLILGH
jgi:hypothetical protein